jgi:hypothetical protein
MSSLMQHHGGTDVTGRKVELLMYRKAKEPPHPPACDHCGTPSPDGEWQCSKCNRPFWGRYTTSGGKVQYRTEAGITWIDDGRLTRPVYATASCRPSLDYDAEPVQLTRPNGTTATVPRLYRIFRRPIGMWGCWVVFRWSNEEHAPDLSVPISVYDLPKDAKPLTDEEAAAYWFSER